MTRALVVTMPGLSRRRPQLRPSGATIETFFAALPSGRIRPLAWIARHPRRFARAARSIGELPVLEATPTASPDGRVLATGLARRSTAARRLTRGLTAVVRIPEDLGAYSAGHSRRTLRAKRNEAIREGVHWVRVDDPAERERLLVLANAGERTHPDERYRTEHPDNRDLLPLSTWWLALSSADEPLLLAVAAVDDEWALLRYFRVLRLGHDATAARYLMTEVLIRELADAGVRVLATDMSPVRMSSGLRDFQHRVGFELVRVRTA